MKKFFSFKDSDGLKKLSKLKKLLNFKTMTKSRKIFISVIVGILVAFTIFIIVYKTSIAKNNQTNSQQYDQNSSQNQLTNQNTNQDANKDSNRLVKDSDKKTDNIKSNDDILKESRKKVGSDDFGFIDVPQSFTIFKDDKNKNVNDILQWSTPNGYVVVTLSKIDLTNSKSKEELKSKTISEVVADNMITNVKDHVEATNKKALELNINDNIENAYNVRLKNVKSKDSDGKDTLKSVNAYVFNKKGDANILYTLLLEGKDDQLEALDDIIKTWTPTNTTENKENKNPTSNS